jgi:site-specific DNA recombinase
MAGDQLRVILKVRPSVRGGRTWLLGDNGRAAAQERRVDAAMVRALRAGHELLRRDEGSTGQRESMNTYERRLCGLAHMAPDIQRAILAGRQPADLTLDRLIKCELPLAWADQRVMFGFEAA